MKTFLKFFSSFLLLFNGIGAIYGGYNLMIYPDGSSLLMSPDYLQYSPFRDYFIPGIILFTANGLFSFFVLGALLFNHRNFSVLIKVQGIILTGWIVIQMMMVHMIYYLHIILGSAGLLLILCGWVLKRTDIEKKHIRKFTL